MVATITREAVSAELNRRKAKDKATRSAGRQEAVANGTFGLSKKELKDALESFTRKQAKTPIKAINKRANEVFAQIKKSKGVKAAFQARAQVIREG